MIVRLTGKYDKEILKYIEDVDFCTAKHIAKIFYKYANQGEAIARRRLKRMCDAGYLKVQKLDKYSNTNLYIFDNIKNKSFRPSMHKLLLLNYYSELIYNGADIIYFKKEQSWMDRKIISDGFCVFKFNNKIYYNLIEVVVNHNDDNFKKYDKLYNSNEVQQICEGMFPNLILIDNINHKKPIELENNIKIIKLDFELNEFPRIFV